MLGILLAGLLLPGTVGLDLYLRSACAPHRHGTQLVEKDPRRSIACLRDRMDVELTRLVVPVRRSPEAARWVKLQALFERWAAAQCRLNEEMQWVDLVDGTRFDGTNRGLAEAECLERAYGERAYMLSRLSSGDLGSVQQLIHEREIAGKRRHHALTELRDFLDARVAGNTTTAPPADALTPRVATAQWRSLSERARVAQSAAWRIAYLQCDAMGWGGRCHAELAHYFLSLVDVDQP